MTAKPAGIRIAMPSVRTGARRRGCQAATPMARALAGHIVLRIEPSA